ncbi:hypothetical protein [Motilibacter deserti]|uniref:Integral membrane protein n=1 Tax=Motilibacter deserti TaxID=2714956 RepID=A0ABX0GXA0_9ACTN|nr:hypothetical protein [Motilibacter deserti]NHC14222.1 hypothetical protein [Motilibacter deserti]
MSHREPAPPQDDRTGLARQISTAYAEEVDRTHRSLLMAWLAFAATFGLLRALTYAIHEDFGPFRDVSVGGAHLHHYVWGIAVLMGVGLVSLIVDTPRYNPWLGAAYGIGCALVVDEYALLLNLSDVYWTREGRVSVDVALGVIAVLGAYLTAAHFWNSTARLLLGRARERAVGHRGAPPPAP